MMTQGDGDAEDDHFVFVGHGNPIVMHRCAGWACRPWLPRRPCLGLLKRRDTHSEVRLFLPLYLFRPFVPLWFPDFVTQRCQSPFPRALISMEA